MIKKIVNNQSGQSLMEMLIAIFILILALVATIVLIVTSINAARDSMNKLVATNLSREGIEVVRNIRDSNWINPDGEDWDSGLIGDPLDIPPVIPPAIPVINNIDPIELDFTPDDFNDPLVNIKLDGNDYHQGLSASGNDTLFTRLIYLNSICQDNSSPANEQIVDQDYTDDCGDGSVSGYPNKVGVRVISEVRWHNTNSSRKVIIEDRLYNWQNL